MIQFSGNRPFDLNLGLFFKERAIECELNAHNFLDDSRLDMLLQDEEMQLYKKACHIGMIVFAELQALVVQTSSPMRENDILALIKERTESMGGS